MIDVKKDGTVLMTGLRGANYSRVLSLALYPGGINLTWLRCVLALAMYG